MDKKELHLIIENSEDELLKLLDDLIQFETVSPPARNTGNIQEYIKRYLEKIDFNVDTYDFFKDDVLLAGIKKGSESDKYNSLILNGHVDVAAITDINEWNTDPFKLHEKNGRLYGRGTSDMKSAIAANLLLLKLFHENNIVLKGDILFQSAVGEEAGEAGTRELLEKGYTADYALVSDTSSLEIQGQGGCITGWITIKSPVTYHDGNRRNIVHAGGGIFSAGAVEKMVNIIQGLQSLERHWAVTKSYPGFPSGTNTINPAFIKGGTNPAFMADECSLWITVHFYPDEKVDDITSEIDSYINAIAMADPWLRKNPPSIKWGGRSMIADKGEIFPSLELNTNHPGFKTLAASYYNVTGKNPVVNMSTTVNDSGWFSSFNIPAACFGPGELKEAHSNNESADKKELINFMKIMGDFIFEWCNSKK